MGILLRAVIFLFVLLIAYRIIQTLRRRRVATVKKSAMLRSRVVPCAVCGLHVPIAEAVESEQRYFCSQSHRDAASSR